jgi:hypothetical protein
VARLRENDVERQCLDFLAARGYVVTRIHTGLFKSPDGRRWIQGAVAGTPDYVAVHETHPGFYLETKRPGGSLSLAQMQRRWEIERGYRIPVALIDRVEKLRPWLDAHERETAERKR